MFSEVQTFEVKENDQPIRITIAKELPNIEDNEKPFVNLYIYDTTGVLRAQGFFRGEPIYHVLSDTYTSIGCIKGDTSKGIWRVILLSEKEVPNFKYTVDYGVDIDKNMSAPIYTQKEDCKEAWYKGDFHTHTVLSDGSLKLEEVPEVLKKNKLDFVFLTDHNMIHPYLEQYKGIFGGMEMTLGRGHMNFHGIQETPFRSYENLTQLLSKKELTIEELVGEAKACNLSINHPFMKPWHYTYQDMPVNKVGSLEIVCDPTWQTARKANDLAIRFIRFLWTNGHKIVAIGGSDSHIPYGEAYEWASMPSWYGDPATFVYAKGLTEYKVLEGLRKGHVYVSRGLILDIVINKGKYLPGDTIQERSITYHVQSPNIKTAASIHFIINGKIKCTKELKPLNSTLFHVKLPRSYSSVSVEVRDADNAFLACVNPIYYGKKNPAFTTWKQAVDAFFLQEGAIL